MANLLGLRLKCHLKAREHKHFIEFDGATADKHSLPYNNPALAEAVVSTHSKKL